MSDSFETELNEAIPGDIRDTSTAKAIATNLKDFTVGNALPDDKRKVLTDWMKGMQLETSLFVRAYQLTGKLEINQEREVMEHEMILLSFRPPNRAPIIIAILSSKDEKEATYDNQLIKEAAEVVIDAIK